MTSLTTPPDFSSVGDPSNRVRQYLTVHLKGLQMKISGHEKGWEIMSDKLDDIWPTLTHSDISNVDLFTDCLIEFFPFNECPVEDVEIREAVSAQLKELLETVQNYDGGVQ